MGVATRANNRTVHDLRAACIRAVTEQDWITAFCKPAEASQGDGGPEVAGQVGGVAPVSDIASAVEPKQRNAHTRLRVVRRPMWLRKGQDRRKACRLRPIKDKLRDKGCGKLRGKVRGTDAQDEDEVAASN